ncbi:hypothetical protein GUITHDRAFT_151351, partial [Guillardia theta CCMP2712]
MLRSIALAMLCLRSCDCFVVHPPWSRVTMGRPTSHRRPGLCMNNRATEFASSRLRTLFNQLEEDGKSAVSLPEFEKLRVQSMVKRCVDQSDAGQDIPPLSLSALQENSCWALAGRWKMIFAPLEQMKFWNFYPSFQLFLDVDLKNSNIDFNLEFGPGLLLQGLKCSARSQRGDKRFLLSYAFWRIAICFAGV